MRYYWIKDRINQKQFKLTWRPGVDNMADYFSKHHPPWYHKKCGTNIYQKIGKRMRMRIHRDKIDDIHVHLCTYTCSHDHTWTMDLRTYTYRDKIDDIHIHLCTYTCSHDHTWTCAHIHVRMTINAHIYVFAWPYTCNISKRIRGCTYNVTNHKWRTAACEGVLLPPR